MLAWHQSCPIHHIKVTFSPYSFRGFENRLLTHEYDFLDEGEKCTENGTESARTRLQYVTNGYQLPHLRFIRLERSYMSSVKIDLRRCSLLRVRDEQEAHLLQG
jgi:hypothetical protein